MYGGSGTWPCRSIASAVFPFACNFTNFVPRSEAASISIVTIADDFTIEMPHGSR